MKFIFDLNDDGIETIDQKEIKTRNPSERPRSMWFAFPQRRIHAWAQFMAATRKEPLSDEEVFGRIVKAAQELTDLSGAISYTMYYGRKRQVFYVEFLVQ